MLTCLCVRSEMRHAVRIWAVVNAVEDGVLVKGVTVRVDGR